MLKNRNIAFFIDVDNVGLKSDNYANVIEQLQGMGTILSGKIYGAGERKHKEIYADAELHGYRIERPMRVKRRGRKDFDPRIYVDVVDAVSHVPAIDAVCIIAQPTDLVYLYSYLRAHGIKVIAMDNVDDAGCAFIDEVIDLGIVLELKLPKQPKPAKPAPAAAEEPATTAAPAPQASGTDRTEELLREIELLRMSLAEQNAQRAAEPTPAPASEPAPVEEQPEPAEEPAPQTEEIPSIVDETKSLLDRIAEMREEQNAHHEESAPEPAPVEEQSEPVEEPAPQPSEPAPVAEPEPPTPPVGTTANDSDLIRRIEQIRQNSKDGDDDYIEEIRKLLDGLE